MAVFYLVGSGTGVRAGWAATESPTAWPSVSPPSGAAPKLDAAGPTISASRPVGARAGEARWDGMAEVGPTSQPLLHPREPRQASAVAAGAAALAQTTPEVTRHPPSCLAANPPEAKKRRG